MSKAKSPIEDLERHAERIRDAIKGPKQADMFRCAVEVGYLVALSDGEVDDTERKTIVRAVEILSVGAVVEWETEELLAACIVRVKDEGPAKRSEAAGRELAALGQAEVGLLVAALVARATKGIDKREAETLKSVGAAAGLTSESVKEIVKRAASLVV